VEEVRRALERRYPPHLRDAGIGGTVHVWFFVDEEGRVQRILVSESSGQRGLDDAVIQVANTIEFTPALNRDRRMPVWVSLPVTFTTRGGYEITLPPTPEELRGEATRERAINEVRTEAEGAEAGATVISPGIASETLRGTSQIIGAVASVATGEPLQGVQVYIPGTGLGTLTNREGRFLIFDVPAGEREVVAHLIGYGDKRATATVPDGETSSIDFDLQPQAIGLSELVVMGTPAKTPTFTPYTVRPEIKNREEMARALEREYPPLLKDAGIGGTVEVWFHLDETGRVLNTLINESSGHLALDEAALVVARGLEFTPALKRDRRVPVWVSLPLRFRAS
jgi:TonB family protein